MNTELEEDQNNNEQTSPTVNRHANQSKYIWPWNANLGSNQPCT